VLLQIRGIAYAQNTEIGAAFSPSLAGLEQRLALLLAGMMVGIDGRRSRSGGSECCKGKDEDNSRFEELHGCRSEL